MEFPAGRGHRWAPPYQAALVSGEADIHSQRIFLNVGGDLGNVPMELGHATICGAPESKSRVLILSDS